MFRTKDDQITGNKRQNQRNYGQINIYSHDLLLVTDNNPGLNMFPAEENQIISNNNQNYCSGCQIRISFHKLFPPLNEKINKKNKQTTDNSRKKIGISNIPFNHSASPLLIKSSEKIINRKVESKAIINVSQKAIMFWGGKNRGEITPAANQATAMLPKISDNLSIWRDDNFIIGQILSLVINGVNYFRAKLPENLVKI